MYGNKDAAEAPASRLRVQAVGTPQDWGVPTEHSGNRQRGVENNIKLQVARQASIPLNCLGGWLGLRAGGRGRLSRLYVLIQAG